MSEQHGTCFPITRSSGLSDDLRSLGSLVAEEEDDDTAASSSAASTFSDPSNVSDPSGDSDEEN